jgi:squalene-hopene/tetraprenyl-beta-curcumene cyclase
MSYWARTVIVPLLVIGAKKPLARNPRRIFVEELYTVTKAPLASKGANLKFAWSIGFNALDRVLKAGDNLAQGAARTAIQTCVDWVIERLNGEDGLGAIYPAMANSVMMFDLLGYPEDHPARAIARAVGREPARDPRGRGLLPALRLAGLGYALAAHAMLEAGGETNVARAKAGLDWLKPLQVLDVEGDWAEERPGVRPGGWAFQYNNAHYPTSTIPPWS